MDLNLRKEQFSIAYVRAIAAVAGVKVLRTDVDDDSIDVGLERSGGCAPKLDLQLKCTADPHPNGCDVSFALKLKNYDDLRRPTIVPRWLVVLFVPPSTTDWLTIATPPYEVILKRCAWWVSLAGQPDVDNDTSVTVKVPHANLFTPDAVRARFDLTAAAFTPV